MSTMPLNTTPAQVETVPIEQAQCLYDCVLDEYIPITRNDGRITLSTINNQTHSVQAIRESSRYIPAAAGGNSR